MDREGMGREGVWGNQGFPHNNEKEEGERMDRKGRGMGEHSSLPKIFSRNDIRMFKELKLKDLKKTFGVIAKYHFTIKRRHDRKRVGHHISRLVARYGISSTRHEYDRALGNAIAHGRCPVKCTVYIGQKRQMLCVIKDHGEGFDYRSVIQRFHHKEVYYQYHGYGMRCFSRNEHLSVDWCDKGRQCLLLYR
jgi:hypothetical protein